MLAISTYGQTPADLYIYEEYQAWLMKQPAALQRSVEVLETYKTYLVERGADSVDAESQVRAIRALASEMKPSPFLAEMVAGRKTGRALDVNMGRGLNAIWLAEQGWEVTGWNPGQDKVNQYVFGINRWDLIVLTDVDIRKRAGDIVRALRPGGIVVIDGTTPEPARLFPQLRVVRMAAVGSGYCGEKAR